MSHKFSDADIPPLSGKIAIVTGANSGLGFEISRVLANHGARVIMACRNMEKAQAAAEIIRRGNPPGSVMAQSLDLASLASIDTFASNFIDAHGALHLLINNAGLMAINEQQTKDGFEMQFGVNHLGHFALSARMMPILLSTPNSRIVSMSSSAHRMGKMNFDDLMYHNRPYKRFGAYAQSKLAILLFIFELNRRLRDVAQPLALAAHPGVAKTKLGQNGGGIVGVGFQISAPLLAHSAYQGALPALKAATDASAHGGEYFGPKHGMFGSPVVEEPSALARNSEDAARLWRISEELTNHRFPFLS